MGYITVNRCSSLERKGLIPKMKKLNFNIVKFTYLLNKTHSLHKHDFADSSGVGWEPM
jgi:hypothetical protein